jgi:hypothetical protein
LTPADTSDKGAAVLFATATGLVGGLVIAVVVASVSDPSHLVPEVVVEPYTGGYLDVRLVAILFGVPFAGFFASTVSWVSIRTSSVRTALAEGVGSALIGAGIMGFLAISIGTWWVDYVPRDPNGAAAVLVPVWTLFVGFTVAFVLDARGSRRTATGSRDVLVKLLAGAASLSLLVGVLFGAIAGGFADLLGCTPTGGMCTSVAISSAMESGALVGAGLGFGAGMVAALVVWALRARTSITKVESVS